MQLALLRVVRLFQTLANEVLNVIVDHVPTDADVRIMCVVDPLEHLAPVVQREFDAEHPGALPDVIDPPFNGDEIRERI
ncbi:MAG: hypothetical protein R3F19_18085 [Verrucomicrobiales bacterium]